jgi:uncharacterized membrane protein
MAESESKNRQAMEKRVLEMDAEAMSKEFSERRVGQMFGLIIGLAALEKNILPFYFSLYKQLF